MLSLFTDLADWLTYEMLRLEPGTRLAEGAHFFIEATSKLLALLVDELVAMIIRFENAGFSSLRERWQAANAHHDKAVRLIAGAHEVRGICRGVDDSGALLVETDTGIQAFHGGEISVRAQE